MEFLTKFENWVAGFVGAILIPTFNFMYGPNTIVTNTMIALIIFIILDWMSGVRASKKDNSYGSKYGIDGVFRTLFMILLPAGGHFIDIIFNLPAVAFGALAGGLIYHTLQSMTANCVRAGWGTWLPINVLNMITNWVSSELESKISRATQRVNDKEGVK